jgi:cell division protein FtsQ
MIKKMLYIAMTVAILGGSLYLAATAGIQQRHVRYQLFTLFVENPQKNPLITDEEIHDTIVKQFGKIEGQSLEQVPIFEVEQFLKSIPYISSTNVYSTLNGSMSATVTTRVPVLRVFNSADESFLIDSEGVAMPVSLKHPQRLLVASGNITESFRYMKGQQATVTSLKEGSVVKGLWEVARLIRADEFLNAFIAQIYVNQKNEMELVPRLGQQVIVFGTAKDASAKLEKLKAFYLQVVKQTGWDTYKIINLKFDNQVVCSK